MASVRMAFHGLSESPSITADCAPQSVTRVGYCVRVSVGAVGVVSFACKDLAAAIMLKNVLSDVVLS